MVEYGCFTLISFYKKLKILCAQQHSELKALPRFTLSEKITNIIKGFRAGNMGNGDLCWRIPILPDPWHWAFVEYNIELQSEKILEDQSN